MDNRSLGIFLDDDGAIQGRAVTQLIVCEIGNGVLSGHRGVDDPRDGAPKSFLTRPAWMDVCQTEWTSAFRSTETGIEM